MSLLVRLGLTILLGTVGKARVTLVQTHHLGQNFKDKLDQAMAAIMHTAWVSFIDKRPPIGPMTGEQVDNPGGIVFI